jgi:hypothetical protein
VRASVAGVLAAVLLASPAGAAPSKTDSVERVFPRGLPYALYEDECAGVKRCVWDARHQGNGEGRSYILTRFKGDYLVAYITHRRAHRLQALWCQRPSVTCNGYED